MTNHERDLLISISSMLLLMSIGVFMAATTLDDSMIFVLLSAIKSLGSRILIFLLLGVGSVAYEVTTVSCYLRTDTSTNKNKASFSPEAIGGGIGILILGIILGFPVYIWGNDEAILGRAYLLVVGGFGFSLAFGMMFLGAIITRLRMH